MAFFSGIFTQSRPFIGIIPDEWVLIGTAFGVALAIALLATPLAMRLAKSAGVVDQPGGRHVHTTPTPRWGGLAMFAAFVVALLVITPLRAQWLGQAMLNKQVLGILAGAFVVTLIGALDDKYNVPAKVKLLGQIVAASLLPAFGIRMAVAFNVDIPGFHANLWLFLLSCALTVVWVVAITNTINLIDGLDGLAAGISGLAALTFVIINIWIRGKGGEAMLAAALVGGCLGFLRYNFHPARVFMGDAGSHFLGFTIGALSMLANWKVATGLAFVVPVLILAVPIFDTAFAIVRRLCKRQPIFSPDKGHLHHRLLDLGMNQRFVVLTIYLLTAMGCMLAILIAHGNLR